MAKIIIIEDEENLRYSIRKRLQQDNHNVTEADSVVTALHIIQTDEPDLIITDINLEAGGNGLDLVKDLRSDGYAGGIIVITASGSVEVAVEAMKCGADEYLQKPLSLEELRVLVRRSLDNRSMRSRLKLYQRIEETREQSQDIIGQSECWLESLAIGQKLASVPVGSSGELTTILLMGETGVGKGLLARHIHNLSPEHALPFVHVNCSVLPATLIESELFGHQKGAFTDARETRQGLFELADGGTIFLDEIGDIPLELQSKLLIVVEQGTYRRLGSTKERRVNARVIAATNHDLMTQVEEGKFRRDLFYRLNALTIHIPPLRDRENDALVIAEKTLQIASQRTNRKNLKLGQEAIDAIKQHRWPGNVRELVNSIQRAALLAAENEIKPTDLGLLECSDSFLIVNNSSGNGTFHNQKPQDNKPAVNPDEISFDFESGDFSAESVEKRLITEALKYAHGNVSKAAKLIGMNRSSLRYRIERYGLDDFIQELISR